MPDRNSIETFLDCRYFTRERRLTLEITLALMLNMVRPGERLGYQKVIDRFFSDTGLAFPEQEIGDFGFIRFGPDGDATVVRSCGGLVPFYL